MGIFSNVPPEAWSVFLILLAFVSGVIAIALLATFLVRVYFNFQHKRLHAQQLRERIKSNSSDK